MTRRRYAWFWLAITVLVALVAVPAAASGYAQTRSFYWDRFDVDITVNRDGSFDVVETQTIVFVGGPFRFGFRGIDGRLTEGITDIAVADDEGEYTPGFGEEPRTFTVTQEGQETVVRWYFEPLADETRTFVIRYRVLGGLRYYETGDQLWWKAVYADRPYPVNASTVTVRVPAPAVIQKLDHYFTPAEIAQPDPQTARFVATERIPPNQEFEVRVEFTPGVVAGAPAAWQATEDERVARLEAQAEYDRRWRPLANLLVGSFALMLFILAPVGLYLLWYLRGRDVPATFVAEYLPEPPSEMPPGLVGTLMDERADMEDILATLIDLARRGYVRIEEQVKTGAFGLKSTDFVYTLLKEPDESLREYERLLLKSLFGEQKEQKLSDLKQKFYVHLPKIQEALYQEVAKAGLFERNPEQVRNRWSLYAVLVLIGAFFFSCGAIGILANYSDWVFLLPCGPAFFVAGLMFLARFMPRRTAAGAEAYARWRAFRTYLQKIEKYTDLARATELFERYLPYAIAFGLEKDYIRKWAQVPTAPPPPWYVPHPRPYYDTYGGPRTGPRMPVQPASAPQPVERGGPGGLGEASKGMAAGLAEMSSGLSAMLSSAANTLSSRPAPQGGGWTPSGGRGGGWSGGGSFGGGGGGGGRGGFG